MQEHNKSTEWFNDLYTEHKDNHENIPWATQAVNSHLASYLDDETQTHEGKALVIGCGLGDDAHALEVAGYDVLAIDVSEMALELAQSRSTDSKITYEKQDIFDMPEKYKGHFDFVFEAYTIQSLPREFRAKMINAISETLAPNAKILVVADKKTKVFDGPPWPLTQEELELFKTEGLIELGFETHQDKSEVATARFRALFEN